MAVSINREFDAGNVRIREMSFSKAGDETTLHAHEFDHVFYIVRGSVRAITGNREVIKRASDGKNWVLIQAGTPHNLIAQEDGSLGHCIMSHRFPDGSIAEAYTGWEGAYE